MFMFRLVLVHKQPKSNIEKRIIEKDRALQNSKGGLICFSKFKQLLVPKYSLYLPLSSSLFAESVQTFCTAKPVINWVNLLVLLSYIKSTQSNLCCHSLVICSGLLYNLPKAEIWKCNSWSMVLSCINWYHFAWQLGAREARVLRLFMLRLTWPILKDWRELWEVPAFGLCIFSASFNCLPWFENSKTKRRIVICRKCDMLI